MLIDLHKRLGRLLRRFHREERGVVAVETVIIAPFLISGLLFALGFYDFFLQQNVRDKATYTMTDALSRETAVIDDTYIDNLKATFDLIAGTRSPTQMRVSVIRFHKTNNNNDWFELRWSEVRGSGGLSPLTQADMVAEAARLPLMVGGQDLIVVETSGRHVPIIAGSVIDNIALDTRMFMTPRFASQLCFTGVCVPSTS
ncbi:MAG: hypothetical protein CVT70_13205 [Alphaproteobacteria bacterium HGW-Alphaproteobacteria-1]|jgi:hypothetical protein|nr:MAG: hypothetical protein CVT70_13205 [Alphaproteobacteria bacterium HGW-Alphaproteobacteria-1]